MQHGRRHLYILALFTMIGSCKKTNNSENQNCTFNGDVSSDNSYTTEVITDKLKFPTTGMELPGYPGTFLFTEIEGTLRLVQDGKLVKQAKGDITDRFFYDPADEETGLFGLGVHPDFKTNRRIFLMYLDIGDGTARKIVISEWQMNADFELVPDSEQVLLEVPKAYNRHNGGSLVFGDDGYLYISIGDGAEQSDPEELSQDLSIFNGKILRIDVDSGSPYSVPSDNPFVGQGGARPEIFAYGLRNAWRINFDRKTGDLWAGDVAFTRQEEVNIIEKGGNYGWPIWEGNECTQENCDGEFKRPLWTYIGGSTAVIGGFVYRGDKLDGLEGWYLFGDTTSGLLSALWYEDGYITQEKKVVRTSRGLSSFIEDSEGELYVTNFLEGTFAKIVKQEKSETGTFPRQLMRTGCLTSLVPFQPRSNFFAYEVMSSLWSDGMEKKRFIGLPDGAKIKEASNGGWTFPEGTVFIKNFGVPADLSRTGTHHLLETRFLVKKSASFVGYSYKWNEAGTSAEYIEEGVSEEVKFTQKNGTETFKYFYPATDDCGQCHSRLSDYVLGFTPAQAAFYLDADGEKINQEHMFAKEAGILSMNSEVNRKGRTLLASYEDKDQSLTTRVRSYLHANCSACHNSLTKAGQTSLDFDIHVPMDQTGLCDDPVVSDLGLTDPKIVKPGEPSSSILYLRVASVDEKVKMPPILKARADKDAVSLIKKWIKELTVCE